MITAKQILLNRPHIMTYRQHLGLFQRRHIVSCRTVLTDATVPNIHKTVRQTPLQKVRDPESQFGRPCGKDR